MKIINYNITDHNYFIFYPEMIKIKRKKKYFRPDSTEGNKIKSNILLLNQFKPKNKEDFIQIKRVQLFNSLNLN